MGLKTLLRKFPLILHQPNFRASLARGLIGQPAKSENEAALHDVIDLIPIVGDFPNIIRIATNKGNRVAQLQDTLIGAIPIVGDLADLFLTSDTNMQQFKINPESMRKGKIETVLSGAFLPNAIEKYIGGVNRNIWED